MDFFTEIADNLCRGYSAEVEKLIRMALEANVPPLDILHNGLISGMDRISVLFKNNEIYIPEVLVAASSMHAGADVLRPYLANTNSRNNKKIIVGTVKGDLHDIGKNLVSMMLEGAGFQLIDLGVDVSPEKFVHAAREQSAHLIGISALLTTTMHMMKITVDTIHATDLKNKVKIVIGGAPITQHFADLIGADGYAEDFVTAVDVVKRLLRV
ncbi:MAG: cobalamin-binding protein [Calditrichaeota bacterium]|nr:cobalamin-binding protein [Calditrichota bacterium]